MTDLISPLRLQRLKKGYSQQGLSFLTGIPQVQISYAERGYTQALKPEQWQKVAKSLGVRIDELFPDNNSSDQLFKVCQIDTDQKKKF